MTEIHELTVDAAPARGGRRRVWAAGLAGIAVLGIAAGAFLLLDDDGAPSSVTAAPDVLPPAGYRFVGLSHAAIAVPEGWGTNAAHCGTPTKDTVVIDVGAVRSCLAPRPAGVESIDISRGDPRFDVAADRTIRIDGVDARRSDTVCTADEFSKVTICTGTVYIPSERVSFRAESSTDAAAVDDILARIRMVPGQVGVPGFRVVQVAAQERSQEAYLAELRAAGLTAQVQTRVERAMPAGFVLDAAPAPGTLLRPGDAVTVTSTAPAAGPADELTVGMNTDDSQGAYGNGLGDQEIRDGATITLGVGDRIWAYASGKREETLAAELAGSSLTDSTWDKDPNKGHSWVASRAGTTKVTLFITADGKRVELGTVTVVVR